MAKTHSENVQKHLSDKKHQLRVWVDKDKYDIFKQLVEVNGDSIYGTINRFIDNYIEENKDKYCPE